MCQQCQDLAVKYLSRWMPKEEMYGFMFRNTCFPSGDPEHIEPQLIRLNNIADQLGDIWLAGCVQHEMWDTDYELTRYDGGLPWWNFMCFGWCDGLEQPGCEE